jgi:hypothetical protein
MSNSRLLSSRSKTKTPIPLSNSDPRAPKITLYLHPLVL